MSLFKLSIILGLLILTNCTYYYRTEWYPGCKCGVVNWQSQFTTKESCEKSFGCTATLPPIQYWYYNEWWPLCKCGIVPWQSPYTSEKACLDDRPNPANNCPFYWEITGTSQQMVSGGQWGNPYWKISYKFGKTWSKVTEYTTIDQIKAAFPPFTTP